MGKEGGEIRGLAPKKRRERSEKGTTPPLEKDRAGPFSNKSLGGGRELREGERVKTK